MAVSKRTRFEILRRDDHACQYCGQMAPDVVLHVDHVIPVALGGSDDPSNLVAACKDCNMGKSSISPDSPIVAAVAARSAEYAVVNANRNAHIEADLLDAASYQDEFLDDWNRYKCKIGGETVSVPMPEDWQRSLNAWWKTGVSRTLIEHAVVVAMTASKVSITDAFKYFAGVVWRTLDTYDQRYPAQTAEGRVYSPTELEQNGMFEWSRGYDYGKVKALQDFAKNDVVANHIDHGLVGV